MAAARSTALDALRGVAALGVFVFHAWLYSLPVPSAGAREGLGDFVLHELRLGLVLFFVLSGFLLYGPWVAASLGRRPAPAPGEYARRRAARILPAYYVALIGSIALLWPLDGTPGVRLPPADGLPLFAIFAQNATGPTVMKLNPPMWTLAVEVSFYAVLPFLGWAALRLGRRRAAQSLLPLALIAAGVAFNAWLAAERPGLPYAKSLPAMLPYFAFGMLAAIAVHGRRLPAPRLLAAAGALLVAGDAVWHALRDAAGTPADLSIVVRDVPAAAGFALVIAAVASAAATRTASAGALRPLAALGVVSYGFYLWHVPVLLWLRGHGLLPLDPVGAAVVGGAVSLALAAGSWRFVERPAIAWARVPASQRWVVPRHVVDRWGGRGGRSGGRAVRGGLRPAAGARAPAESAPRQ
jgi:peptidoglycan/LPS O-acetylase OafA/YrhL